MDDIIPYQAKEIQIDTGRKLPTCREERIEAYNSAIKRIAAFLRDGLNFNVMVLDTGAFAAEKKLFGIELKLEDNQAGGRMAYVTSNPEFDPTKEISKDNRPGIVTKGRAWQRSQLHSRDLLRVTITGTQSLAVFVELRQGIPDPEKHIIKSVMFILQNATDQDSDMNRQLRDTSFLKDVPSNWLPKDGDELEFPEIAGLKQKGLSVDSDSPAIDV